MFGIMTGREDLAKSSSLIKENNKAIAAAVGLFKLESGNFCSTGV